MTDFYFAKANDDGTYGEPIKAEVVDFDLYAGIKEEKRDLRIDWLDGAEMSFDMNLDYKQMKDFVWAVILKMKRSEKHLLSKNLVNGGDEK